GGAILVVAFLRADSRRPPPLPGPPPPPFPSPPPPLPEPSPTPAESRIPPGRDPALGGGGGDGPPGVRARLGVGARLRSGAAVGCPRGAEAPPPIPREQDSSRRAPSRPGGIRLSTPVGMPRRRRMRRGTLGRRRR